MQKGKDRDASKEEWDKLERDESREEMGLSLNGRGFERGGRKTIEESRNSKFLCSFKSMGLYKIILIIMEMLVGTNDIVDNF